MIFMRFHEFQWILWISIDFEVRGFATLQDGKGRPVAPIETFTRSQLAAISSIFMDFLDFHWFPEDFMRFHGFRGSGVGAGCYYIDFHDFHEIS